MVTHNSVAPQMPRRDYMPTKDYHYTECGLDNVIIRNANFVAKDHDGEQVFHIPAVGMLHRAIAEGLINQPGTMTGPEIRFLRTEMGMTQSKMAELVHRDTQSVGRWERNETPLEPPIDILIRQLAAERLELQLVAPFTTLSQLAQPNTVQSQITIERTENTDKPYAPAA